MKKFYTPTNLFKTVALFFAFWLLAFAATAQKTWSGAAGASWNVAGNWTPVGIPAAGNTVTINAGATPVVTAAAVCASIQINNATNNNTTSLTVNSGQTLTVGGGTGAVTIGSNTAMGNSSISTTSLIVNGNLVCGNINQTPGNRTTGSGGDGKTNLTISSTGVVTVTGNVTGTTLPGTGAATATASVIFTGTGTLNVTGTFTTSVFTPSTGIVNYNGTSAQTVSQPAYGTLKINNSNAAGVTIGVATTVGNLTIGDVTSSILKDNGNQITSTGTFNLTAGKFVIGSGSLATSYPGFSSSVIATNTIVDYISTSSQTIAAVNYYNLSNTISGPRTLPATGTVGIASIFLPGTGNYTLTSGTTTVSFNGSTAQTIPTINPSLTFNTLVINNPAGISSIANDITVTNSLVLTKGIVTTGANKIIIASGGFVSRPPTTGGWVFGNLQKPVGLGSTTPFDFEIGDASNYNPVTINYAVVTTAGSLIATVTTSPTTHPAIASSGLDNTKTVTRYWTLTKVGSLAGTYDATFTYNSGSVPGGANTNNFVVREYNSSAWVTPVPATGTKTATSTLATGLSAYGDFCVGESTGAPNVAVNPALSSSICEGGNTSFTSSSSSVPTPTIQWQRSNDGGATWDDISAATDGGGKYTNFTTSTLNIANALSSMNGFLYRAKFTNINGSGFSTSAGGKLIVSILPIISTMAYPSTTFSTASPAQSGPAFIGSNYTGGSFSYTSTPGGLTLANFNSSTGAFTPVGSNVGSYTITYTVTNGNCSPVSKSTTINISSAAISYAQSAYCSSDASSRSLIFSGFTENLAATITVSGVPGTANLNNTRGTFTPSSADPGVYTVTYTDGPVILSTTVTVTQLPAATIGYLNSNICILDGSINTVSYSGTTGAYTGGIFSYTPAVAGHNLNIVTSGGTIPNPLGSIIGVGSDGDVYNVVYTIPASGGCPAVATSPTVVTITAIPSATLTYGTGGYPICKAASSISPTVTGLPGGGTFTQPTGQTGLSVNASGVIDPATSTPGNYNMIYTVNSGTSCGDVSITSANINIVDNPSLSISYASASFCTGDGTKAVTFSGIGSSAGATFSASPAGLSIALATGLITPSTSTAAAGSPYMVTASIPNCPLPPITAFVEIDPSPTATISYPSASFCELDGGQYPVTITGATGGQFTYTSIPAGLTLNIDQPTGGSITPSGSNPGSYTITYTLTVGTCTTTATANIVITPRVGAVTLNLGAASTEPTCEITAATPTSTYTANAANSTSYTWSISPVGAGAITAGGVVTWTVGFSGTAIITVTANGCSGSTTTSTRLVNINPNNTATAASSIPNLCISTPLPDITHTTTGATGIGTATGLPAGVTAIWSANTITISGTPTAPGTFNYSIPLTGGCSAVNATGTITVSPNNTVSAASSTPILCINTVLTNITHTTTGATGIGVATGLPAGVTAAWSANTITISGTPTAAGTFSYSIPLTGGCSSVNATGTITVNPSNTVGAASSTPTLCINTLLPNITHTTTGATGIGVAAGLPAGVTAAWSANTITISGTPTVAGLFSYSIPLTGGCSVANAVGTINVTPASIGGSITPTLISICSGTNTGTMTLSGYTGSIIRWEQSINAGSTWTPIANTAATYNTTVTQPTLFRAVVQNGVGICASANSAAAQVIIDAPFTPIITASANPVCLGSSVTLTASNYTNTGLVVAGGDFASANPPGWNGASANNSNGDPNSGWGEANGGKAWNGVTYNSGGKFMIINGTGTPGNTSLTTPVFSLVGLSSAYLAFNQAYNLTALAQAQIQISIDGGGSYTTLQTYNGSGSAPGSIFGNPANFSADPKVFINLNAYLGMTNLVVKFLYTPQAGSNWAVDNIVVTNTTTNPSGTGVYNSVTYTWSPAANLSSTTGQSVTFNSVTSGAGSFPYSVTTTTSAAGCVSATPGTITVVVNPLPTIATTGTLAAVCFNAAAQTTTMPYTATTGTPTSYSIAWTGLANQGSTAFAFAAGGGTLTGIIIPAGTLAGTYSGTMTIINGNGCSSTQSVSLTVNGLPTIATTGTLAAVCTSAGAQTTTLVYTATTNSPTSYSIAWTGLANQGSTAFAFAAGGGTLTGITIPAGTLAGTYSGTMTIINANGCANTQAITIKVNALPTLFTVTGGGNYCSGGTGSVVGLSSSQSGVSYQLQLGGVNTGSALGGTGAAISFGLQTAAGTYTIIATNTTTTCSVAMTGNVVIGINPLPTLFNVTGGGTYCAGGTGVVVGLAGSQSGVNYQLQIGGVNSGSVVAGTGSAISFGLQTVAGTYTVIATNAATSCTVAMSGNVTIAINPLPTVTVAGTTVCGGAPSTITATPGTGGSYSYAWTVPATATNPGNFASFTSTVTGNYSVVITNTSTGCVSAASAPANVITASNIWTGVSSTSWQDKFNWTCVAVPTPITDVIIPTTAPNMPTLNATSFSKSLELQGSAVITLNGQTLNNVGGITLTGTGLGSFIGSLTSSISINAPGTSSIINLNQGSDGTSNALNNLTINGSGASVTLNTKTAIYGALTPTLGTLSINNELVLRSTDTTTAMVGQVGGAIAYTGAGRVTVERYFPATRKWHLFTSPVSGGGSIFDNWQNGGAMSDVAPNKGTLVTGSVLPTPGISGNGLDGPSPNLLSTLKIGNDVLTPINNTRTSNISKGTGATADNIPFFIFVRGDRNLLNFSTLNSSPTTLSGTGKLQTGPQTFNVAAGTFTMIGNPYASPLDFAKIPTSDLTNFLYVWDPYLNLTGAYVTFFETSLGSRVYVASPSGSPGNPSTIIQSGQAFYVNNSGGTSLPLIIDESAKSTVNNQAIFRPMSPAAQITSLSTNLYAFTNKDSAFLADGNLAQFDDSYNPGIDWMDAKKMTNTNETFSLLCNGVSLAANRRPLPTMNDTLFYQLTRSTAKKYQFQLIANNLDKDNLAGFLQDQFTHTATPINMNGTTKVNFAITSDKASAAANRFRVVFKPSVVYTNVAANVLASDIGVQWNVASEENIKGYEIERSTDGTHFTKVADQASAGNSDAAVAYNWLDVAPALGQYYYRIRSISYNDVIGYSNIVKVKLNRSTPAIYVFPNPVTENAIHLQMNGMEKGVYAARLINNLGQVVMSNYIAHMGGTATETLRPANRLLAGIYQLEIAAPDKKITTVKVIVQYNKQ